MNTNALTKHYDVLTPVERLPLLHAAAARGDDVERDRLMRSAPRVTYSVPDHFGLAQAFDEISMFHLLDLLDTAAEYHRALWIAESEEDDVAGRMLDVALMNGYVFKVHLQGWRLFCSEHGFDPERYWSLLPGCETIRRTEKLAAHAAFLAEGAAAYVERLGGKGEDLKTAESVAESLRAALKQLTQWWG
jgi:hypothetical protein